MKKLVAISLALLIAPPALAATLVIDDFTYTDSAAARAVWQEMAGSLPVEMADAGPWGNERVMKLPCDFSTAERQRAYWDRTAGLDLSGYRQFAIEVFVPDSGAVSNFTLYFRSGSGWYGRGVSVAVPGWQTLYFSAGDFNAEGTPTGWDQIDAIRLSPWRETSHDSFLAMRKLYAFTPALALVLDTRTADASTAENTTELLSGWLARFNVPLGVITDTDVEAGLLAGSKMAILPYNDTLSDAALTALESHVAAGGKLMVYYELEARVAALLGIQRTGWTAGDFASYSFQDSAIQYLPSPVRQDSWNITIAAPAAGLNARTIATWQDSAGNSTGHPAWLASDNGLFMSHIMLGDDADTKQAMLLILVGHYVPEIWSSAAAALIDDIGRIADYISYVEAVADIRARAASGARGPRVEAELAQAETLRNSAIDLVSSGDHAQAVLIAGDAKRHLQQAYYLCQSPVWPEFRAVWQHSGTGPYPGDWPAAIDALADNNFNAVFPNMLWGGLAHYNSSLLPHSTTYNTYGDQIAACIGAAHARGVEVHVWKVNWNLGNAPQPFVDSMRAAGRTQVDRYGQPVDWLCPSHPDNFALERDSMLEVVANYDVDGIHFDYIRYPDSDACYCDGCRARFEQQTGNPVAAWPDDVVDGGPLETEFLAWRRQQITDLVDAVYRGVQAIKPQVKVSAAVFSSYGYCRDGVGQDWVNWIDQGIVDFLCPMDYTNDFDRFESLVTEQLGYSAGRVPIFPGIGASSSSSAFGPDGVIAQIQITRNLGSGGFIIFNYDRELAEDDLPALGLGATAAVEPGALDAGTADANAADGGASDVPALDRPAGDQAAADNASPDLVSTDQARPDAGGSDAAVDDRPGSATDTAGDARTADRIADGGCACTADDFAPSKSALLLVAAVVVARVRRRRSDVAAPRN
ncbi:MAG: family 10 glycosylhydrolase [Deltaproteobacteria bacterium]|nr:family 10 glycosylhydrolase [Deltaproteobacteria bacterium]